MGHRKLLPCDPTLPQLPPLAAPRSGSVRRASGFVLADYTASEEKRFSILIDCWGRQIPTSRLANSIFQMQTLQIEGDVRRHSCGFSKGFVVRIAMFGPPIERGA